MRRKYDYTLKGVEETLKLKTWWAALAVLPVARRVTLFVANYTDIKPNTITFCLFLLRLASAVLFLDGRYAFLVAGAFLFEIAYVLDCMDGSIARLKNTFSAFGAFFDHMTDAAGVTLSLAALAAGQGILFTPSALFVVVLYVFMHYITFVAAAIFASERNRIGEERSERVLEKSAFGVSDSFIFRAAGELITSYRNFFARKHFKAFLSPPDFEALVCFICPLIGCVELGFKIGVYFLALLLVYKIFSYLYVIKANTLAEGENEA